MGCGCKSGAAAAAARGKEIIGYRITWPDKTCEPPCGTDAPLLGRVQAQMRLREKPGGTAKSVERSLH